MMKEILCVLFSVSCISGLPMIRRQPERIVGGEPALKGEFPWIVQIQYGSYHYCGGVILNRKWIVTAAHCSTESKEQYGIVAGQLKLDVEDGTEQLRNVEKIIVHPNFNSHQLQNDVALMRLSSPLMFGRWVKGVELPVANWNVSGDLVVAGWGSTSPARGSTNLMKVTVPFVPRVECNVNYGGIVSQDMICAGKGGKDSCQGDSGGPIQTPGGILVGLVSWGYGCAREDYPGVYTNIPYFTNWILENIGE